MGNSLTPLAKNLLAQQHDLLLFNDQAFTSKAETVKHIIKWCEDEDIQPGKWLVSGKKYRFTRAGISKIRDAYLASIGEDIFADFSEDNHQSASAKSTDEKQGKIKPTHHLILAALLKSACLEHFSDEFYACSQMNLELDMGEMDFSKYDTLIMIENRDSFNDWHLFQPQTPSNLSRVLPIYRGDSHYLVAATQLLKYWRACFADKPVVYFGDFDLAGLRIAVSGNCTHLLLPDLEWLEQNLVPQHYPDNQQKYLTGLQQDCTECLQPLLQLMSDKRAGLRQQKMRNTPLVLHPIS